MDDKEVGEIWRLSADMMQSHTVRQLIHKLVNERAQMLYWQKSSHQWRFDVLLDSEQRKWVGYALRDYNIDPATWESKP
jgi:hypothetical protein